jgi:hypothetical protein
MPLSLRERISAVLVVGVAILAAGCSTAPRGPRRQALSGRATHAGDPIPCGRVVFEPDPGAGNSGPAGYADIVDGRYATLPGQGAVAGPLIVRVSGFDGVRQGDAAEGRELFPEHTVRMDLTGSAGTCDIDVPPH